MKTSTGNKDPATYADETADRNETDGMAAALSSQMEQPGTYEELLQGDWRLLVTRESLERTKA